MADPTAEGCPSGPFDIYMRRKGPGLAKVPGNFVGREDLDTPAGWESPWFGG